MEYLLGICHLFACSSVAHFFSTMYLGKNQVAVGIVPINFVNKSSESALSVYPVAIANCKEERCVLRIIGWLQKKPITKMIKDKFVSH